MAMGEDPLQIREKSKEYPYIILSIYRVNGFSISSIRTIILGELFGAAILQDIKFTTNFHITRSITRSDLYKVGKHLRLSPILTLIMSFLATYKFHGHAGCLNSKMIWLCVCACCDRVNSAICV